MKENNHYFEIKTLVDHLKTKNRRKCLQMVEKYTSMFHLTEIYVDILQPVLQQIGTYWDEKQVKIDVKQEMVEIINLLMTHLRERYTAKNKNGLRAILATTPGEKHIIGLIMVADALTLDGWKVWCVEPNSSVEEVISLVKKVEPDLVGFSVTMTASIAHTKELIAQIKELVTTTICVGGIAFYQKPNLWQKIGADLFASTAKCVDPILTEMIMYKRNKNK